VNRSIVHVASGREWRGGQRQVWLLSRELARLGVDQVLVTGSDSELARRSAAAGVRVRAVSWRAGLDPRVLWPILSELRSRPAILHAHDAHALTLAGVCSTLIDTPLVVTRRVDFPLQRPGYWVRADRVIAISQAVADVLVTSGVSGDRIRVIHSGIPLETARGVSRLGIRGRLGLHSDTRIAANVAALVRHKDHETLLGAAKHLVASRPDLHWVIAGEGELRATIESRIEGLGLAGRVHLLGQVEEPTRLIADSDLFVMSSRQEGLGTSVLDAMALGIPVASTSAGGLPEMLRNGAGLMTPPEDPIALAGSVVRILEEPGLRAQMIASARVEVLRFSALRMAEEMRSVYRSCAHSLDGS
jgi:glycosyltransferase involved in cell wall biosynthesis